MKRSSDQNRMFHGRLRVWASAIEMEYGSTYPMEHLKLLAKYAGFSSGNPAFTEIMHPKKGTSSLSTAAMDELINLMESNFSVIWPEAYVPARGDDKWGVR